MSLSSQKATKYCSSARTTSTPKLMLCLTRFRASELMTWRWSQARTRLSQKTGRWAASDRHLSECLETVPIGKRWSRSTNARRISAATSLRKTLRLHSTCTRCCCTRWLQRRTSATRSTTSRRWSETINATATTLDQKSYLLTFNQNCIF